MDAETKLSAARTRLILDKPFLGALVLRLPMEKADPRWCKTTATDARKFYYNERFIDGLDLDRTQFVLAHEALHCALSHFHRRQHRVKWKWDLACDFAINPLLVREGLKPPEEAVPTCLDIYEGMTAEEIYPLIEDKDQDSEIMDKHVYDADEGSHGDGEMRHDSEQNDRGRGARDADGEGGGGGASQPPPLDIAERERLSVQWRQRMAGAAQQAMQAGKLSGMLARLVDHLLQPQLPWRMLLARYVTAVARDDYSYMRPSRREGEAIFPSLRSAQVDVIAVLDTSASISTREMTEFVSELSAIKGQIRARIILHACDAELHGGGPWVFEPWEEMTLPDDLRGGGGTRFTPVFDWVSRTGQNTDLLVYFTDADGEFPAEEPPYPVLWLVKGRARVPWGQRIQLN